MPKYRRKSDGEIVEAAQTAWQVESSDGEFRYVVPVLGSNFWDEYEAVTEPKSTDADFNKFRHRKTGEVVEAWQWTTPQRNTGSTSPYGLGDWVVGPEKRWWFNHEFRAAYEPIHPERKRLQSLCDEISAQPGMPALCPELLAARADGRVVDTNSGFYVKDREPEKPAEPTICAECEHQAITPAIPACVVGQIPPEARDWVTGGYNEDYGIPIDGKWRPYCNIVNTDGRCPNFKGKD